MAKEKKYTQSKVFEFKPTEKITEAEIIELSELIRIGISGEILDKASPDLKKHFFEVKTKKAA
jgi:hypothetical protein